MSCIFHQILASYRSVTILTKPSNRALHVPHIITPRKPLIYKAAGRIPTYVNASSLCFSSPFLSGRVQDAALISLRHIYADREPEAATFNAKHVECLKWYYLADRTLDEVTLLQRFDSHEDCEDPSKPSRGH